MANTASNITRNAGDDDWNIIVEPYPDSYDFKANPVLIGVYQSKKVIQVTDDDGKIRDQAIYTIVTPDGKKNGVWGSYIVDEAMKEIAEGQEVRIEYLGTVPINNGKNQLNRYIVATK